MTIADQLEAPVRMIVKTFEGILASAIVAETDPDSTRKMVEVGVFDRDLPDLFDRTIVDDKGADGRNVARTDAFEVTGVAKQGTGAASLFDSDRAATDDDLSGTLQGSVCIENALVLGSEKIQSKPE